MPLASISVSEISDCLPQTQCTRCGYPCCEDYAKAIKHDGEQINRCPPGDKVTISALSTLTGLPIKALDQEVGPAQAKTLALIDESRCIGCVLCIKACPVGAIHGANKQMHTVIQDHCTGCELCLPVCPTDCITMQPLAADQTHFDSPWPGYSSSDIEMGRTRFARQKRRLEKQRATKSQQAPSSEDKMAAILAAVERRRAAKQS